MGVDGPDVGRLYFQDEKKERLALRRSTRAGGTSGMGKQIAGWWIGYRNIPDSKGLFYVRWQKYRPRSSTVNTEIVVPPVDMKSKNLTRHCLYFHIPTLRSE